MPYIIRPMELDDIPEVVEIERQCFSMPWPAQAYRRELKDNKLSRYIVAQWVEPEEITTAPRSGAQQSSKTSEAEQPRSLLRRALGHLFQGFVPPQPASGSETLAGYAGLWLMLDEAHITTVAVRPTLRGMGLGELLFIGLLDLAAELGAKFVTLEVRVSNVVAQNLYKKYGFREEGVRKRYYSDNGEDALIMWSEALDSESFKSRLDTLKAVLNRKLAKAKPPWSQRTTGQAAAM